MLIVDNKNRTNYSLVIKKMERDCLREYLQQHINMDLSKMTYLPSGLVSPIIQNEAEEYSKTVVRNFKEAVLDLNFYGEDPRRMRVFIRFDPNDWTMHGVNFWRYREIGAHINGMPSDENMWAFIFNGGLCFHKSDQSWSVHT